MKRLTGKEKQLKQAGLKLYKLPTELKKQKGIKIEVDVYQSERLGQSPERFNVKLKNHERCGNVWNGTLVGTVENIYQAMMNDSYCQPHPKPERLTLDKIQDALPVKKLTKIETKKVQARMKKQSEKALRGIIDGIVNEINDGGFTDGFLDCIQNKGNGEQDELHEQAVNKMFNSLVKQLKQIKTIK
jgi:hypothetical protein